MVVGENTHVTGCMGKSSSSSPQHIQFYIAFFHIPSLTNIWNKPGCSFLTFSLIWVLITWCSCLSRRTVEFMDYRNAAYFFLGGLRQLLSPSKGQTTTFPFPAPFYTLLQAHHSPRCETAMVMACSLTLPCPRVRRSLSCYKSYSLC